MASNETRNETRNDPRDPSVHAPAHTTASNDPRQPSMPAPNTVNTEAMKIAQRGAEADRLASTPMPAAPADDAPRNLTRESLELTLEGQYIAAGKSLEEAKGAAKKRALEMIPADAK